MHGFTPGLEPYKLVSDFSEPKGMENSGLIGFQIQGEGLTPLFRVSFELGFTFTRMGIGYL